MTNKVWFITGSSRGFGRVWTEAALKRGDRVVATSRQVSDLTELGERFGDSVLTLALDVTNAEQVKQVVERAHAHFGRLDVILNNAGYSLVATGEEASEDEVRAVFDTNYFGTLRVIQAALPLLRKQGSGHIVGVSSTLGMVSMPLIGFYCATKWAVEALHESLAKEVGGFGIKVSIIEPGAYATEFGSPQSIKLSAGNEAYEGLRTQIIAGLQGMTRGEPNSTASAVLKLVDSENPPLRLMLGSGGLPEMRALYAERLETWTAWSDVANAAQ